MKDRKNVEPDGKGRSRGRRNSNQNILYKENYFNKRKKYSPIKGVRFLGCVKVNQ